MLLQYESIPRGWVEDVEPTLQLEWASEAGLINARPMLTIGELKHLQAGVEELLAPFTRRQRVPAGARRVRLLAYFLPGEADERRRGCS
jgi:hypothetical protein